MTSLILLLPWLPHFSGTVIWLPLASAMISLEIIRNLNVGLGVASSGVLSNSHFIRIHPTIFVLQHSDRQTCIVWLCINAVIMLRALSWQLERALYCIQADRNLTYMAVLFCFCCVFCVLCLFPQGILPALSLLPVFCIPFVR
jgi:hypothetical protein